MLRHGPKIVDAVTRCLCSSQKPGVAASMLRHGPKIVGAVTRCLRSPQKPGVAVFAMGYM
jgi:hypothetical protein